MLTKCFIKAAGKRFTLSSRLRAVCMGRGTLDGDAGEQTCDDLLQYDVFVVIADRVRSAALCVFQRRHASASSEVPAGKQCRCMWPAGTPERNRRMHFSQCYVASERAHVTAKGAKKATSLTKQSPGAHDALPTIVPPSQGESTSSPLSPNTTAS